MQGISHSLLPPHQGDALMSVNNSRFISTSIAALTIMLMNIIFIPQAFARSANDWGGDGDPSSCKDPYTVASTPLYGKRGPTRGEIIGHLELRWSNECHANWSRVILYGGMYSDPVTIEQNIQAETKAAGAMDFVKIGKPGTSAHTPMLILNDSKSAACVQAWVSSDFGTPNFHTVGARFCY